MTTEEKILEAAQIVFTRKGHAAARMQEIADQAGINKGLLHYYFKNKEKLFLSVFEKAFGKFSITINRIINSDLPLFEKIEQIVHGYLEMLMANPYLPAFIMNELNQRPDEFVQEILQRVNRPEPAKLMIQLQLEADAGRIRRVNPFHFVLNLMSMCVFPFIAKPMFQGILGIDDATYLQFMQMRKKEVTDFIIHSLRPEPSVTT